MELLSRKHWELFLTWTSYTSCVILQRYCTFFCCLTCHLYAHCLFPSYFRKTFLPQWWKHITMKWIATDNLLTPLFRKEVTMFQDLFVLYHLSSFCLSRNNLKLLLKPFSFFLLLLFFFFFFFFLAAPVAHGSSWARDCQAIFYYTSFFYPQICLIFPFEYTQIINYLLDQCF